MESHFAVPGVFLIEKKKNETNKRTQLMKKAVHIREKETLDQLEFICKDCKNLSEGLGG